MARRSPDISQLPLNALRAFEASARHLSFTKAGLELRVSQAAVSQQVKVLETSLRIKLFRRLTRGLALTEEGEALRPAISDAFGRISQVLERFENGRLREIVTVGVVGTFASGWLLPRLRKFGAANPQIDLRIFSNNNRVDLAGEGLDYAIRFGDGAWHGTDAVRLFDAFFTPMCSPSVAKTLRAPLDLHRETLLRSYRPGEWAQWFEAARCKQPRITGPMFEFFRGARACGGARCRRGTAPPHSLRRRSGAQTAGAAVRRRGVARGLLAHVVEVEAPFAGHADVSGLACEGEPANRAPALLKLIDRVGAYDAGSGRSARTAALIIATISSSASLS